MADNVSITAGSGTSIATDDVGGVQFQRVKVTHGADGTANDASATTPLPTYAPDTTASGTISATDSVVGTPAQDGTVLSGTPTASSYVGMQLTGGDSMVTLMLTGTFSSGTYWFEASVDATSATSGSWITITGKRQGTPYAVMADNTTTAGVFRCNVSGFQWFRVRVKGASSPSVAVAMAATEGVSNVNIVSGFVETPTATATKSNYTITGSNGTVLAANANRMGAAFYNDSTTNFYLDISGGTSSTTSFTVLLLPGAYYELPTTNGVTTSAVTGIGASATGTIRVTEWV